MSATLHVIFGPQGAGKTTYGQEVARRTPAVLYSMDDWMARLYAADMPRPLEFDWMMERVERCESLIWSLAAATMAAGTSAILDFGLMRRADRARITEIAEACDLRFQFHYVTAPQAVRRARLMARNAEQGETYAIEVTPEMFDYLERVYEAPDRAELVRCLISESA